MPETTHEISYHLEPLLVEYERVIQSLQIQIESYHSEHSSLKDELNVLMSENVALAKKLDYELKVKLSEDTTGLADSKLVSNLRKRLKLCDEERQKSFELYQSSLHLIEKLENQVHSHQAFTFRPNKYLAGNISEQELKMKAVKQQLEYKWEVREQLESDNLKLQADVAKLKLNLESKEEMIASLKEEDGEWRKKCNKLEQDCVMLNETVECVVRTRNDLEGKLDAGNMQMNRLVRENSEAKSKVAEALDIIEKLLLEKNAASMKLAQLQEFVNKLQLSLRHVIEEAGKRVAREMGPLRQAKEELEERTRVLEKDLKERTMECMELETKYKKAEKIKSVKLEKEKITLIKGSEAEIVALENQLRNVHRKHSAVELELEKALAEKSKLETDYTQLERNYQCLLSERAAGENRLKEQLEERRRQLEDAGQRAEFFVNQIRELQEELEGLMCENGDLRRAAQASKAAAKAQVAELETQLDGQVKLNDKWRNEAREMTGRFAAKIAEMKAEMGRLAARNRALEARRHT